MRKMMKTIFVFSITLAVTYGNVSIHNPFYCFATDPIWPQKQMFGSIVSYEAVRGNGFINSTISTCKPSKFIMYGRHGTRLPSMNDITQMTEIHERLKARVIENYIAGRTQLCTQDMENIRNWTINPDLTPGRNSYLADAGWNELKGIGERFHAAFPTVFPVPYNESLYLFQATHRQRSIASLQGFAEGLFGEWQNIQFAPLTEPDRILRPNDDCQLFTDSFGNSSRNINTERDAFEDGPEFAEMLVQVNRKLGFLGANQLNSRDVRTVWNFCRFEFGWDSSTPSPWCAAFSIANHAVFDYSEDLVYYYWMGYGGDVPLFTNMNCHIMQEILRFLESSDPNDHLARMYNTHAIPSQLFLVTLGLFGGDAALNRHNFSQQTFRQWRSSVIAPMGSNLSIVRFDCEDGDNDLLVLYNEKPLNIPGCDFNGMCKQSTFVDRYRRFLTANCAQMFCSRDV